MFKGRLKYSSFRFAITAVLTVTVALFIATVQQASGTASNASTGFVVSVGQLPQSGAEQCADGIHSTQEYHNSRGVWAREIPYRDFGTPVAMGRWFGSAEHTNVLFRWRTTDDQVEMFDIASGAYCSATPTGRHFAGFGPRADIEIGVLRN